MKHNNDFSDFVLDAFSKSIKEFGGPISEDLRSIFGGEKVMWKPRRRDTLEFIDVAFDSAIDCSNFINKELKYLNKFLSLYYQELNDLYTYNILKSDKDTRFYNGSNIIQPYNVSQNRWCDGFDF